MEPLSPNDPLFKLLGQAKPVQPRPGFTQDVVRAARQTVQEQGWLARIKAWSAGPEAHPVSFAWAAAAVAVAALIVLNLDKVDESSAPQLAQTSPPAAAFDAAFTASDTSPLPEVEAQWNTMDRFDALLAVQDTSELTDREIAFLLY